MYAVKEREKESEKRVREKKLVLVLLAIMLFAFGATILTAKAALPPRPGDHVAMYIWNSYDTALASPTYAQPLPTGSNTFPWKAYGTGLLARTTVYVVIDSPDSWTDTPLGIVAYTVSLQVDPSQVEVLNAAGIPDLQGFTFSNGFLGMYEMNYLASPPGILTAPATVDPVAGTITLFGEAIAGYTTLGKGAGGGPWMLMQFQIRTKSGVTSGGSLLTLFNAQYTTSDGTIHDVTDLTGGVYGTPPVPEFPLGLAPMVMLAPLIPIVYLWRIRKRKVR